MIALSVTQSTQILAIFWFLICAVINVGAETEYTKQERAALDQLRPLVLNILTHDYQKVDSYLIRWLKARKMDVNAAKEMLQKTQKWRKDNKVDKIMNETSILERSGFTDSIDSIDKEGRPVMTCTMGKLDIRRIILEGKRQKLYRSYVQLWEKLSLKAREASARNETDISQVVAIVDMQGFTRKQHLCVSCVEFSQQWVEDSENYYPGLLKLQVLVNVPRIYDFLLERTRPLQSAHTQEITRIFGFDKAEWSPFVFKYVAPEQLTFNFGGTKSV